MAFLLTDAYSRNYTGALDASCVHSTLSALQTYMYSDATCYAGQIVAVTSDSTAANNGLYLIVTNPNFKSGSAKSASNSPFLANLYASSSSLSDAVNNMAGVLKFQGVEKPRVFDPRGRSCADPRKRFYFDPLRALAGGVIFISPYLPALAALILRTLSPVSSI